MHCAGHWSFEFDEVDDSGAKELRRLAKKGGNKGWFEIVERVLVKEREAWMVPLTAEESRVIQERRLGRGQGWQPFATLRALQ
jgi:hypothetical protein